MVERLGGDVNPPGLDGAEGYSSIDFGQPPVVERGELETDVRREEQVSAENQPRELPGRVAPTGESNRDIPVSTSSSVGPDTEVARREVVDPGTNATAPTALELPTPSKIINSAPVPVPREANASAASLRERKYEVRKLESETQYREALDRANAEFDQATQRLSDELAKSTKEAYDLRGRRTAGPGREVHAVIERCREAVGQAQRVESEACDSAWNSDRENPAKLARTHGLAKLDCQLATGEAELGRTVDLAGPNAVIRHADLVRTDTIEQAQLCYCQGLSRAENHRQALRDTADSLYQQRLDKVQLESQRDMLVHGRVTTDQNSRHYDDVSYLQAA